MSNRCRFNSYYSDYNVLQYDVKSYQSNYPECFSCGSSMHYSSGFERRYCDTCGFVDGDRNAPCYPRAVSIKEYSFITSEAYRQLSTFAITRHEFYELVYSLSFYDSHYRPPGEGV